MRLNSSTREDAVEEVELRRGAVVADQGLAAHGARAQDVAAQAGQLAADGAGQLKNSLCARILHHTRT